MEIAIVIGITAVVAFFLLGKEQPVDTQVLTNKKEGLDKLVDTVGSIVSDHLDIIFRQIWTKKFWNNLGEEIGDFLGLNDPSTIAKYYAATFKERSIGFSNPKLWYELWYRSYNQGLTVGVPRETEHHISAQIALEIVRQSCIDYKTYYDRIPKYNASFFYNNKKGYSTSLLKTFYDDLGYNPYWLFKDLGKEYEEYFLSALKQFFYVPEDGRNKSEPVYYSSTGGAPLWVYPKWIYKKMPPQANSTSYMTTVNPVPSAFLDFIKKIQKRYQYSNVLWRPNPTLLTANKIFDADKHKTYYPPLDSFNYIHIFPQFNLINDPQVIKEISAQEYKAAYFHTIVPQKKTVDARIVLKDTAGNFSHGLDINVIDLSRYSRVKLGLLCMFADPAHIFLGFTAKKEATGHIFQ